MVTKKPDPVIIQYASDPRKPHEEILKTLCQESQKKKRFQVKVFGLRFNIFINNFNKNQCKMFLW